MLFTLTETLQQSILQVKSTLYLLTVMMSACTAEFIMISVSLFFFGFLYWDNRVITIQLVLETIDDIYVCRSTIYVIKMDLAALRDIHV